MIDDGVLDPLCRESAVRDGALYADCIYRQGRIHAKLPAPVDAADAGIQGRVIAGIEARERQQDTTGQARLETRCVGDFQIATEMHPGQRLVHVLGTQTRKLIAQQVFEPLGTTGEVGSHGQACYNTQAQSHDHDPVCTMTMLSVDDWPLPYVARLEQRHIDDVDLVVIHCTELPDLDDARRYGEQICHPSATGNSGHYYIDRDGSVHCFVDPLRVSHHTRGYNERSIGVELINRGRYPLWLDSRHQEMQENYTDAQIRSLLALLKFLHYRFEHLDLIGGHEDLDRERVPASDQPDHTVYRKRDPGPLFPWQRVLHASGMQRFTGSSSRSA